MLHWNNLHNKKYTTNRSATFSFTQARMCFLLMQLYNINLHMSKCKAWKMAVNTCHLFKNELIISTHSNTKLSWSVKDLVYLVGRRWNKLGASCRSNDIYNDAKDTKSFTPFSIVNISFFSKKWFCPWKPRTRFFRALISTILHWSWHERQLLYDSKKTLRYSGWASMLQSEILPTSNQTPQKKQGFS